MVRNRKSRKSRKSKKKWIKTVTTDAMDLEHNVFKKDNPRSIAKSIKRSVERSKRLQASQYKSGISMISYYVNRAGKSLSPRRKRILLRSKNEFRKLYGRDPVKY